MRLTTLTLIAATALPLHAFANPQEDALEARHGYMKMLAINMGTLAAMAKGEMEYDEAAASAAGANIEALTGYDAAALFVEGTAAGEIAESEALPAIWQNPEGFRQKFAGMGEAAAGAAEALKGGQGNVGPVVAKLGGSCKACHDDFRQRN